MTQNYSWVLRADYGLNFTYVYVYTVGFALAWTRAQVFAESDARRLRASLKPAAQRLPFVHLQVSFSLFLSLGVDRGTFHGRGAVKMFSYLRQVYAVNNTDNVFSDAFVCLFVRSKVVNTTSLGFKY